VVFEVTAASGSWIPGKGPWQEHTHFRLWLESLFHRIAYGRWSVKEKPRWRSHAGDRFFAFGEMNSGRAFHTAWLRGSLNWSIR
jgi:hypothetical protein